MASAASHSQKLLNPGFEAPYRGSGNTLVADRWTAFRVSADPQFLQSTFEKMDGSTSQQIQSNGFGYDAGVYQQVTDCAAGARYRFAGWLCTSYDHAFSRIRHCPDGMMVKRIGVDPKGGADPKSPDVIWSWEEPLDRRWRRLMVDFVARSSSVTVYARVANSGNVGYDLAWLDVFEFGPSSHVRISNPDIRADSKGATITWTTDLASDSKVRYWKWQTTDVKEKDPNDVTDSSYTRSHSVTLKGLLPGTQYYFEAVSKTHGTPAKQETVAGGRVFSTTDGADRAP